MPAVPNIQDGVTLLKFQMTNGPWILILQHEHVAMTNDSVKSLLTKLIGSFDVNLGLPLPSSIVLPQLRVITPRSLLEDVNERNTYRPYLYITLLSKNNRFQWQ